jgi:hypothetical protein
LRTRISIVSRISATSSDDFPFGSSRFQSSSGVRNAGHASSTAHPIPMTISASSAISCVSNVPGRSSSGRCTSSIAVVTSGWGRPAGSVPADTPL